AHDVMPAAPTASWRRFGVGSVVAVAMVASAIVAAGTYAAVRRLTPAPAQPAIKQLTFRSGPVRGARFAPDGKTVMYGAAWEGRPIELFAVREQNPGSSAVSLPAADLLAISSTGELAGALRGATNGPFGFA